MGSCAAHYWGTLVGYVWAAFGIIMVAHPRFCLSILFFAAILRPAKAHIGQKPTTDVSAQIFPRSGDSSSKTSSVLSMHWLYWIRAAQRPKGFKRRKKMKFRWIQARILSEATAARTFLERAASSVVGPSRRWRSPALAAAYWGSPAATVAPGPQGATYAQDPETPQGRRRRARPVAPRADGLRTRPGAWALAAGAVEGSAVILAPASSPPLGRKNAQASQAPVPRCWPRLCRGAMVAAIVMAGAKAV
jgi:hypothetical protein